MTWPFLTIELKSMFSRLWTMPDTCVPTVTVVTACSVPVAPTASTMEPREVLQRRDRRLLVAALGVEDRSARAAPRSG